MRYRAEAGAMGEKFEKCRIWLARKYLFPFSLLFLLASLSGTHGEITGCAVSLPNDIGWPRPAKELYQISGGFKSDVINIPGKIDVAAQRAHMWNLFEGITRPSDPADNKSAPIFLTWYTAEETLAKTPGKVNCSQREVQLKFEPPGQFLIAISSDGSNQNAPSKSGHPTEGAVFSYIAYNQELYDFIRDNGYYLRENLLRYADPNKVRLPIKASDRRSVALKFAWWPVSKNGLTPLPVWDWDPQHPGDEPNPPDTWKRVVAVDPSGTITSVASINFYNRPIANPNVVHLDRFFTIKLTKEQATQIGSVDFMDKTAKDVIGRSLEADDYIALTAMHIITQEFEPWTFGTFWWHDNPNIKKYGDDRPAKIKAPWSNYISDVAFNINLPRESSTEALIAYNPWLELRDRGGQRSGCMACHSRAAVAAARTSYNPTFSDSVRASYNPTVAGTTDPNGFEPIPDENNDARHPAPWMTDAAFQNGTVTVNRLWSLNVRTRPPKP
jgi:hypothetical protein